MMVSCYNIVKTGGLPMKYGYIRPVELYDETEGQKKKILEYAGHLFIEAHADNKKRTALEELLDTLEDGDELFVTDFCVLADSTKHLVDIIDTCISKPVKIHILNPGILVDEGTRYNFQKILNEISNFQSDVVKFRTQLGVSKAIKDGKKMGRPRRSDDNIKKAVEMYMSKQYTLDEIKEKTNISRATLYRHLES